MSSESTWRDVDAWIEGAVMPGDPVLDEVLRISDEAGLPSIAVSPAQGRMLYLLALAQSARRILEVGTLGGYSGIWLARALGPQGELITLEIDPHHAEVASGNFRRAGVADRIRLITGAALQSLAAIEAEGGAPLDLSFIDADKPNNQAYAEAALAMSRPGALLIVDNVVRAGRIAERGRADDSVEGARRVAEWVGREPRLEATVVQTVGRKGYDGFLLARVRS